MLKNTIVILMAASLMFHPARADVPPREPAKQEQRFCKAFIGVDDAVIIGLSLWLIADTLFDRYMRLKREGEIQRLKDELKAKAERCS